jgi:hypothetical protein
MDSILDKDFLAHFPSKVSEDIGYYAKNVAFKWSRYLFTRREGRKQYGYCTHCGQEFETLGNSFPHNFKIECYGCGSMVTVKNSARGRSKLVDECYFVWYAKSEVNPQAIVAYGMWAFRDYRNDFKNVETKFVPVAAYLFEPNNVQMYKRSFGFPHYFRKYDYDDVWVGRWKKCTTVHSLFCYNPMSGKMAFLDQYYSKESITKAVEGTPFSWSGWEKYEHEDMTKFFALFVKHPCIEYFTKLGFLDLVEDKLMGHPTNRAINWRGKNLFQILKINKQELRLIKDQGAKVSFEFLTLFQRIKKSYPSFSTIEAIQVADGFGEYYFNAFLKTEPHRDIRKNALYLIKQNKKYPKNFSKVGSALVTWKDYIDDCNKLRMNLKNEAVLYPVDLHKAHQDTIRKMKIKADKALNSKITKRLKELEKYFFEYGELFIRPAMSTLELLDEGNALNHCVGKYAERYAKGETNIFVIRRVAEPNKPYFTMEVKKDVIVQTRGLRNCEPNKDVLGFIKAFTEQKLNQKKPKTRIVVPA